MQKKIQSQDGKITVAYNDVQNVCMAVVTYSLLQYLLLEDLDVVKNHTIYVLDDAIPASIRSKLPTYTYYSSTKLPFKKFSRKIVRAVRAITRDLRLPYLKTATIYAQDHDLVSSMIGKHDYYLLSDCPDMLTGYYSNDCVKRQRANAKANSLRGKIEELIYGTPFIHSYGDNAQCKRAYVTEENFGTFVQEKEVIVHTFQEMWEASSAEKKDFVLNVFGVEKEDMLKLESKPVVFFTQPLCDPRLLSEEEYFEILSKIFNYYGHSQVLIKTHPRDKFDYRKYFPDVAVFDKPINIQLLSLLNVSFKTASTFFSTAVFDLPKNIQVDWIGSGVHPQLLNLTGKDETPPGCHRVTLD